MHIQRIQTDLKNQGVDWLVIPRSDEFLGEYVPACNERLKWATGFSGSAGIACISQESAYLFVDGRYTLQAPQEAPQCEIKSLSMLWYELSQLVSKGQKVGVNLKFHSQQFITQLVQLGADVVNLDPHPVDKLWDKRPEFPKTEVVEHPEKFSGESSISKVVRVITTMPQGVDAMYLHDPHDVAWLLNIRAKDLDYTPIPLCRAVLYLDSSVDLFLSHSHIAESVTLQFAAENVKVRSIEELDSVLLSLNRVQIDPMASACDHQRLGHRAYVVSLPIQGFKAIKNTAEIEGMREAHRLDGLAVQKFIHWIKHQPIESLNELDAAAKLENFRKESKKFVYPSFPTISGFGANGAIVHYHATAKTNAPFKEQGLYLVDSGGQYPFGTTDITRTLAFGEPTLTQKRNYTRVLKGHIRLATAIFPKGTTGHQLDALARIDLWQNGMDYAHGTGHGVGSFLSVHEGPANISPRMNNVPLEPGMVLSNEPGYYKAHEYGIRIENMMLVKESKFAGFLCFETLTRVPYEQALIDESLLTEAESDYLEAYEMCCKLA